jgi:uncharacterized membrane protein (UPF0127 family)
MTTATRPLVHLVTASLAGVSLLIAACGGNGTGPATTPPAGGATTAGATGPANTGATGAPATTGVAGASGATGAATATPEPVASTAATPTAQLPRATFVSGQARIDLPIEVPTEKEYGIGLSGRRSLEGRGMLFAFPEGAKVGFWMKGTHIDLDIAFVDASMKVIQVSTMKADTLDIHQPPTAYVAAIEAPAGWYAASGVAVGAQVTLSVDLKAATGR